MAYRSSAIASSNTGGNLTATPSGEAANDYLSALWSSDNLATPPTYPSGWAEQKNLDHGTGAPDGQTVRYADKTATGGDSFTFTNGAAQECALICAAHSGRVTSSPTSFITATINTTANADPITAVALGGTALSGDDLLAYFATDGTGINVWSFGTPTGPGTFTQRQAGGSAQFTFASLATLDNYGGGTTGNVSETISDSGDTAGWSAVVIAVKAAPAAFAKLPWGRPTPTGPRLRPWIQAHAFRQNIGPKAVVTPIKNPRLTVILQSLNRGNF